MVITVIIIITLSVNSATEVQYLELFHFAYDFLISVPSPVSPLSILFQSSIAETRGPAQWCLLTHADVPMGGGSSPAPPKSPAS